MNSLDWTHYQVFTTTKDKGNPAAVINLLKPLATKEQQAIAKKINFNETIFISKNSTVDFSFRFFAPESEMDFCGHALLAGVRYLLDEKITDKSSLNIETKAGIVPISIDSVGKITMYQHPPIFQKFESSIEELANVMNISADDIDSTYPICYGSTGTWTLIVPIKKIETFKKMIPQNKEFIHILKDFPNASIHPICLETKTKEALMYSRHFSGALTGSVEDSVTGSASGVMGAYYEKYVAPIQSGETTSFLVEQGYEVKKEGFVQVQLKKDNEQLHVSISGDITFVSKNNILI
ncbi:PhzF family phenazine biosynthesis protein [Vagococcus hydrophili]|uniref:PhzF family phenazine biosynthesis protein n=1 Tax=Vagococcus hydrophili TaxID=2714947 RepID=A0A6G8AX56_9ENTE|nr:PhzF family phenazine biosynthesis protein [Vagococcus hydrophili]QIL49576.1 PhzF family phenazine biosynthesis protein [Vagococcus hydrophili]